MTPLGRLDVVISSNLPRICSFWQSELRFLANDPYSFLFCSSGFVFFARSTPLRVLQQFPGLFGVLRIHPDDQVRRQPGQSRTAQFTPDAVGAQQAAGDLGFVAALGFKPGKFHASNGIHLGQLLLVTQVGGA
jgi:hypothetical protein